MGVSFFFLIIVISFECQNQRNLLMWLSKVCKGVMSLGAPACSWAPPPCVSFAPFEEQFVDWQQVTHLRVIGHPVTLNLWCSLLRPAFRELRSTLCAFTSCFYSPQPPLLLGKTCSSALRAATRPGPAPSETPQLLTFSQ